MKLGTSDIAKAYVGSSEVSKMYLGSDLVYENTPPYDSKIEYIQTDGTAYIDTGIAPSDISPIMEITIYLPSASSNHYPVGSDGSGNTRFSVGRTNNRIELRLGNYRSVSSKPANWYTVKLDGSNGETYIDGTLLYTSTIDPLTFNTYSIQIFTRANATGAISTILSGVRVSSFKLWNGNILLQNMIPVRIGQVGYLYNKVNGTFFGNASESGAFILGNDI